jgi:hypothetical protein
MQPSGWNGNEPVTIRGRPGQESGLACQERHR